MVNEDLKDYQFDDIKLTDYIDESLIKLLNRDNASRISFRCKNNFPSPVTEDLIGMTCYRVDLKGEYRLVSVKPDPVWQLISNETGEPITKEQVAANYQKVNPALTSLSSVKNYKDSLAYFSDKDEISITDLSAFARQLLSKVNKEDMRALLGLGRAATLDVPIKGSYIQEGSLSIDQIDVSSMGPLLPQTGDCMWTYAIEAPSGWVMADDGTIGSAASGADHASDDTKDLFYLLWKLPFTPMYSVTGAPREKASEPDMDWFGNGRLGLPRLLGRVLGVAGAGEGLTVRSTGSYIGVEKFVLSSDQMPKHDHGLDTAGTIIGGKDGSYGKIVGSKRYDVQGAFPRGFLNQDYSDGSDTAQGGGADIDNMQPTSFLNLKIKL